MHRQNGIKFSRNLKSVTLPRRNLSLDDTFPLRTSSTGHALMLLRTSIINEAKKLGLLKTRSLYIESSFLLSRKPNIS